LMFLQIDNRGVEMCANITRKKGKWSFLFIIMVLLINNAVFSQIKYEDRYEKVITNDRYLIKLLILGYQHEA